jgi:hypothetical protein
MQEFGERLQEICLQFIERSLRGISRIFIERARLKVDCSDCIT